MATEIELKIRVDSHDRIRARLKAAGADYVGTVMERNVMLDFADAGLRNAGCGLRVRSTTVLEGVNPGSKVTFKGPVQAGALKCREEVECRVEDADGMTILLGRLGLAPVLEFHKRRERWRLDDCVVELDEPANLGLFVEVEGPSEMSIRNVQRKLDLSDYSHVPQSYVEMAREYCVRHNLASFRLTFEPSPPGQEVKP